MHRAPPQPDTTAPSPPHAVKSPVPFLMLSWAIVLGTLYGLGSSFPDLLNALALGGLALAPAAFEAGGRCLLHETSTAVSPSA